jgi:hypothetical protein
MECASLFCNLFEDVVRISPRNKSMDKIQINRHNENRFSHQIHDFTHKIYLFCKLDFDLQQMNLKPMKKKFSNKIRIYVWACSIERNVYYNLPL